MKRLLIPLTLLLIFIVIAGCSNDERMTSESKANIDENIDFIHKLKENKIGERKVYKINQNARVTSDTSVKIIEEVNDDEIENLTTINDLIVSRLDYKIIEFCDDSSCLIIEDDESDDLADLILASREYLYNQGYNDQDIIDILDGEDESLLIPLVSEMQAVYEIELAAVMANSTLHYGELPYLSFIDELNDIMFDHNGNLNREVPVWVDCAVQAIGLDVFYAFMDEGIEKFAKHSLKKAIKKLALKFLGPVGVGIAVAEFSWCMYTNS